MSKKLSLILYLTLAAVCLAFLILTILASSGNDGALHSIYSTIALTVLAIFLAVSIVAYNPKTALHSIGFYLTHAGVLFFLVGCLLYSLFGYSVTVAPPNVASLTEDVQNAMQLSGKEIPNGYYNRIPGRYGTVAELGFNFRISDFVTEYYDVERTSVKHYEATLDILDGDGSVEKSLTVNHPLYHRGWKIYLMSVMTDPVYGHEEVSLTFKRDPGEILSTSGIILTILGAFASSFLRPTSKKEDEQ